MYQDDLDKHIHQQIHDHQSEIDSEALWARLEPQVKRRRGIIWWWYAGVALLGLVVMIGLLVWNTERDILQDNPPVEVPENQTLESQQPATADVPTLPPVKENGLVTDPHNFELLPAVDNNRAPSSLTEIAPIEHNLSEILPTPPQKVPAVAPNFISIEQVPSIPVIPTPPIKITTTNLNSTPIKVASQAGKVNSHFFIAAYTGIYGITRQIEPATVESADWQDRREETSTLLEAFSTELNVGLKYQRGLSLRTGIAYSRMTERFDWTSRSIKADTIEGVRGITVTDQGDTLLTSGEVTRYQLIEERYRNFNTLSSWEVPVILGYSFGKKKLQLMAEAGVYFNLSLQARGVMLDADNQAVDLADEGGYLAQAGLSYHAGLGMAYQLSPSCQLQLVTSLRHFPRSFTTNNHPIAENYRWRGVRLGLSYSLGK